MELRAAADARAVEAAEQEQLVLADRAAESAAELILPVFGLGRAAPVGEEISAVESVVAQELVGGSVQLIGAGFDGDQDGRRPCGCRIRPKGCS